ncbi:MAG: DUF1015 family protein [Negativicutes bacterium]|jgi:uncharacterized protein (DUF1015 family)
MAEVLPFRALRPYKDKVAVVASPPYDVLNSVEAAEKIVANPSSFLRVGKAEAEHPDIDPYAPEIYEYAALRLGAMIDEGLLFEEAKPAYYIYRLIRGAHTQTGIAAAYSAAEYRNNKIKKHELTRPDKENDRATHIRVTRAQTGPVFLAYRADAAMANIVAGITTRMPEYDFVADDGVRHSLWVADSETDIANIRAAFAGISDLYIADGHHRSAAAALLASQQPDNPAAQVFLAVAFPHDQLAIMDYNRVVKDLNGLTKVEFIEAIAKNFRISKLGKGSDVSGKPQARHVFGMYIDNEWYMLRANAAIIDETDCQARLDVNILQRNVLQPLLAIEDPRTAKRIDFVGGIRGMKELEKLVDSGAYAVAFSLFPPSMDELLDIADNNEIMPPKSTWFEPKLRDGIVINRI